MTASLEKIFFIYIFENKHLFSIVKESYFRNENIKFVYKIVRKYILDNIEANVPSKKQILEMVSLEDIDGKITKEILKAILSTTLEDYDEKNFLIPKFNSWVMSNRIIEGTSDIVEEIRNIDDVSSDISSVKTISERIEDIVHNMTNDNLSNDDDLGSDFDDVEAHIQDSSILKVKTGYDTLDHILGNGWDVNSLNLLMAATNNGKSLWMQNLTVKAADLGYNVLYITLEMSEKKVMKRLGAMRLKIPINDYDKLSMDTDMLKRKISQLKSVKDGDLFESNPGKIYTKFWAAGTVTAADFDNYIQKLQNKKNIKIDMIVVDYITLMTTNKGQGDTLYTKGKTLAEALRALGSKYNCPVISGIQVSKDAWNAADISLESIPESKAIAETADVFFAIIRTEEMKRVNKFRLKLLKQRDGNFDKSMILMDLNPTFLSLENDKFVDAP